MQYRLPSSPVLIHDTVNHVSCWNVHQLSKPTLCYLQTIEHITLQYYMLAVHQMTCIKMLLHTASSNEPGANEPPSDLPTTTPESMPLKQSPPEGCDQQQES